MRTLKKKPKQSDPLLDMAVFLGMIAVVLSLFQCQPVENPPPAPAEEIPCHTYGEQEMWCYSGGHLIHYETCAETHLEHGGIHCKTPFDEVIHISADCVVVPAGHEGPPAWVD